MRTTQTDKGARPPAIRFTDEGGRTCLRVPLNPQGSAHAVVLERDYHAVRRAGATGPWYLNTAKANYRYVRAHVPDGRGGQTLVQVARLIMGAQPGTAIYVQNRDRLDLRPENLLAGKNGVAKRCDVSVAERGARYRADRQEVRRAAA